MKPASLTVRLVLPLAAGLLLLQAGVFFWTMRVHVQEQFRLIASDRARLAITQYQLFSGMSPEQRNALTDKLSFQNFSLHLSADQPFAQGTSKESIIFLRRLEDLYVLSYPPPLPKASIITDMSDFQATWRITPLPDLLDQFLFSSFSAKAALKLPDGAWLLFDYTAVPLQSGNLFGLLLELGIQFLLQLLLAMVVIRWLTRPLRQLADCAERMPSSLSDAELAGLPEAGPREVVRASEAFRSMHARIRGFVDERMRLLASISHDLRTPITRLRLQLERENALERPGLVFDALDDLQRLAEDAVTLARTGKNSEPERWMDLVALLESMVADYEEYGPQGRFVRLHLEAPARCLLRPDAFRRCLENLVDNGLRYGGDVDVRLDVVTGHAISLARACPPARRGESFARIRIEDRGPGIPEGKLEDVFEPFYRLDLSRNTGTGGAGLGLGLGIARDLARLNHSDIALSNREGGGLRATLFIPLAD